MDYRSLKANEKTPRGTGFYIQVGHRYYAGQAAEKVEVLESDRPPMLSYYEKGGKLTFAYRVRIMRENGWMFGTRTNRAKRDRRKGNEAEYRKPKRPAERATVVRHTGGSITRLTDLVSEAKVFRAKEQVENACAMLRTMYGETGATISVHYKGDIQ